MKSSNPSESMTLSEAGARFGISPQTLRRLCDGHQLRCERDSRGWRVDAKEVENYLLARRPAGRQSVALWLQGPAPNPRLRDGVGWLFKAAWRGGTQIFVQIWFSSELVAVLQRDDYDVREVVVRAAERLVGDALLESDDLQPGQELLYGSADRSSILKAAGLGDESYLASEAPLEEGVSVLYDFTRRDGLWPGDSVDLEDDAYVDVVVDTRPDGSALRVRTIRLAKASLAGNRGQIIQDALRKYESRCRRLGLTIGLWTIQVAARSRALTLSQQRVLELVSDAWRASGEWPVQGFVEAQMEREYDTVLKDVLRTFPPGLIWGLSPYSQQADRVALTVAGLSHCQSAAADIELFMAVVRYLLERRRDWVPTSPIQSENLKVTSDEVRRDVAFAAASPSGATERLYDLLMQDPFLQHGGGKSVDGKWELIVGPESRRYRGVETIEEYLTRRNANAIPWNSSALPAPLVTPLTSLSQTAPRSEVMQPSELDTSLLGTSNDSDVFVLMPFSPDFDSVWSAIQDTSTELNVKSIRADSITVPGRITAQIVEGIRVARAIVADATGNNPNVMFELGYADALGKPIVVLNQRLSQAPFDLKDWRQIGYSLQELEAMKASLRRFLYQVLVKPREGTSWEPPQSADFDPSLYKTGVLPTAGVIPMPTVQGMMRPPLVVATQAVRVGKWVLLSVTNNGPDGEFSGQLSSLRPDGVHVAPAALPLPLKWADTQQEIVRIMPGQTRRLRLVRYHSNGFAYVKNGKWHIEPPLVLDEKPSPLGETAEFTGIYPPLGLKTDEIDGYRFSMRVTLSSGASTRDHDVSVGFDPSQNVKDE